jgi:hypothetical protein
VSGYIKSLQRQLGEYKRTRLGVKEAGIYRHKGKEVRHAHILPLDLKWLNILEAYRSEVRAYVDADRAIHLHKYFHHLNSSQALALNLFFPFFEGGAVASSTLLRALGVSGEMDRWRCEYLPVSSEGTNVDIAWKSPDGAWTYCEVKLTEQEFGQAKGEPRHFEKLKRDYGPQLRAHCSSQLLEPAAFFAHYQILRNIWLAARTPNGRALFLLPSQNEALWAPLKRVLGELDTALRERVHVVKLETLLADLSGDGNRNHKLRIHAERLSEKYVLRPTAD